MINKASEDWDQVERSLTRHRGHVDQRLTEPAVKAKDFEKVVMKQIGGVREVLKRMCEVSVTRTTVKKAVRDALMPLIREHREELFPELAELAELKRSIERNEASYKKATIGFFRRAPRVPDEVREQLEEFEERLRRISELEKNLESFSQDLGARLEDSDGQLQEMQGRMKDVEGRAEGADRRMSTFERQMTESAAELKDTQKSLGTLKERVDVQRLELSGHKEKIGEAEDRLAELEAHAGSVDDRLEEDRAQLAAQRLELSSHKEKIGHSEARLAELEAHAGSVEDRLEENRTQLNSLHELLGEADERIARSEERLGQVNGRIGQVEGHVSRVEVRIETLEKDLRKEIDDMVQALLDRFSSLHGLIERMAQSMPHKNAVSTANERLQGLEERLQALASRVESISTKVESIDSVTPEVRGMGRQFDQLRDRLSSLSKDVSEAGGRLGSLEGEFSQQISELSGLLQAGIAKWESDQSYTLERLSVMRDALRDQLRSVGQQVEETRTGLLGRLTRRKEGSLKLSRDEWDQMASKMEGIVAGLESVLAKKKGELS
jgi:chromosome segregation ATPase